MSIFKRLSVNLAREWWKKENRDKCEKCGNQEGSAVYMLDGYPGCLCFKCRRAFVLHMMDIPEYKLLNSLILKMKLAENDQDYGEAFDFYCLPTDQV